VKLVVVTLVVVVEAGVVVVFEDALVVVFMVVFAVVVLVVVAARPSIAMPLRFSAGRAREKVLQVSRRTLVNNMMSESEVR
jgi:hypothetical protein